jgi:hypothetical protein
MNTSDILGVLGIVATIIFGVWGLIIVIRRRYPGQLTYVKESYIGLFDSIVKYVPELAVLYNNVPVGQGLVLIKGAILNTGSKDITDSMVEQKLAFVLPPDFRWLTAKIVGNSGNVKATIVIQDNSLVFTTGLFRCNEFIRLQAIAEVPIDAAGEEKNVTIEDRLDKAISIIHRIADTQKVAEIELPNKSSGKRRLKLYLGMSIGATVTLAAMLYFSFFRGGLPADTHWIINDTNGVPHEITTTTRLNGIMSLKGVSDNFRRQVQVEEFYKLQPLKPKIVFPKDLKLLGVTIFLYLFFPWGMCVYIYRERRRAEKLRLLLGIEELKESPIAKPASP